MADYAAAGVDGGNRYGADVRGRGSARVRRVSRSHAYSDGPDADGDRDNDRCTSDDVHDGHGYNDNGRDDNGRDDNGRDDNVVDLHVDFVDGADRANERVDVGRCRDLDDRASLRGRLPDYCSGVAVPAADAASSWSNRGGSARSCGPQPPRLPCRRFHRHRLRPEPR